MTFHIDPATREVGACTFARGKCPFGGLLDGHFIDRRIAEQVATTVFAIFDKWTWRSKVHQEPGFYTQWIFDPEDSRTFELGMWRRMQDLRNDSGRGIPNGTRLVMENGAVLTQQFPEFWTVLSGAEARASGEGNVHVGDSVHLSSVSLSLFRYGARLEGSGEVPPVHINWSALYSKPKGTPNPTFDARLAEVRESIFVVGAELSDPLVAQAVGLVMERFGQTQEEAFAWFERKAGLRRWTAEKAARTLIAELAPQTNAGLSDRS